MNFSCSGLMPAELFQKITADAAQSLGLDGARIIGRIHQAGDHPVALGVPESAYLKGLISTI
jgi:23S rRNA (cytosine1962-C5)-methyltransferase